MQFCKKYISFFRLRFTMGLQYRAAAAAGVATQFAWGALHILAFHAFYRTDPSAFPMTLEATVNYIWLQQAFLAIFAPWITDNDVFEAIRSGSVAYELCRPVSLYAMWFTRNLSLRFSRVVLRCFPILLVALILPDGYRLTLPQDPQSFLLFLPSLALGAFVAVSLLVIVYAATFFTLAPQGLRAVVTALSEFLSGFIIPLPFFPDSLRKICEALPFASIGSTPLRIYSGDLTGRAAYIAFGLQIFWIIMLMLCGNLLMKRALRNVTLQGG